MAEWSQLPGELLGLISERLSADIDFLRFRSVCSSWRSAIPPKPYLSSPFRFPILPNDGISDTSWGFYLSRRTVYLLSLPHSHQTSSSNEGAKDDISSGWIIKLDRENPNRMRLVNPLTRSQFKPLPQNFPKRFDFSKFRVQELGHEYTLQYINYRPLANSIGEAGNLYMEKVALAMERDGFVLLTVHVSGKLVIYRSGDAKWTIIDDLHSPYDDVIFTGGRFYAVDNTGRAVVVSYCAGYTPEIRVVANPVFGGDKKFLVESLDDLYLVDEYLSTGPEDDLGYNESLEFYEEFDCFMSERTIKFKIYKFDEDGQRWIEVASLGDRILFLGDNCSFSAVASQFGTVCKGNCIVFTDQFLCSREDDAVWKSRGIGVFDLDNGSIGPIGSYNGYAEMFWPPPRCVDSNFPVEVELNLLNLEVGTR